MSCNDRLLLLFFFLEELKSGKKGLVLKTGLFRTQMVKAFDWDFPTSHVSSEGIQPRMCDVFGSRIFGEG